VRAGADGCRLLTLPSASFEDLLRRSDSFSRSLLSQLALRLGSAAREKATQQLAAEGSETGQRPR